MQALRKCLILAASSVLLVGGVSAYAGKSSDQEYLHHRWMKMKQAKQAQAAPQAELTRSLGVAGREGEVEQGKEADVRKDPFWRQRQRSP